MDTRTAAINESIEQEIERLSAFLRQVERNGTAYNIDEFSVEQLHAKWFLATCRSDEQSTFFTCLEQDLSDVRSLVAEANVMARDFQQELFFRAILRVPINFLKPSERVRLA